MGVRVGELGWWSGHLHGGESSLIVRSDGLFRSSSCPSPSPMSLKRSEAKLFNLSAEADVDLHEEGDHDVWGGLLLCEDVVWSGV
jgi:hypothetical protein